MGIDFDIILQRVQRKDLIAADEGHFRVSRSSGLTAPGILRLLTYHWKLGSGQPSASHIRVMWAVSPTEGPAVNTCDIGCWVIWADSVKVLVISIK